MDITVDIYTDGACSGNPGEGGWSAVIIYGSLTKEIFGYEPLTTNNRMELLAAIISLETLKKLCTVRLYTDSAYLSNAINEKWLVKWKKNNWKSSTKQSVKNQDLWMRLDKQLECHKVTFYKVKGHSNDDRNNRCDFLARHAIKLKSNSESNSVLK